MLKMRWEHHGFSLDLIGKLIDSDVDEVDPPMTHKVEVGSPLKGR